MAYLQEKCTLRGILMSIKTWIQKRKHAKLIKNLAEKQMNANADIRQEIAFELCMGDVDPVMKGPDAGKIVIFNGDMYAQAILIAVRDKYNPHAQGFDKHYKISTINKIIRTARTSGASVLLGHNEITISQGKEAGMLRDANKSTELVEAQVNTGNATVTNKMYNSLAKKKVEKHTAITFDGDDHYSWFAMSCVVLSKDKEKVYHVMSAITRDLDIGGIRYSLPRYGQLGAIKAAIPFSSQIDARYLKKVNKRTIAAMLPLRNDLAEFPLEGPIFCTDEATGRPIKIFPTKQNPENTIIVGPPGSGKTTMILNLISHAIALGYHVKLIEPKNEDGDGTDYLNFFIQYNGGIARWGPGGVNPDPLIIFYDKKRMGTSPESYRKAKDDWFEVVQNYYRARMGGLNERQSGLLTKLLIDIYMQRGVINEDGDPINTEKWDEPGAIAWPSPHEFRTYWKEQYENKGSIYYHDPSVDALIMNTMNDEPGGTLWWLANSHEHMNLGENLQLFDISQLPDSLKSATSIQIMGACNSMYFPKPQDGTPREQTLLIYDEVKNLSQTKELIPYMERSLTEGRAPGITSVFGMQHPLKNKAFMKTIKANSKNLVILDNLDPMNIDEFIEVFKIPEQYRSRLMQKGSGHGIYFRNRHGVNIRVEVDEMPGKALFESERIDGFINGKCSTDHSFEVKDPYREIFENEGFFITKWLKSKVNTTYPGFKNYNPFNPVGNGGSCSAWIRKDLVEEREGLKADGTPKQDLIGPEGEIHYCSVNIIYGWLKDNRFPNVRVHHTDNADITWGEEDEDGKLIDPENSGCIEYTGDGTNEDVDGWNGKLKRAREHKFRHIIFTGKSTVCGEMQGKKGSLVGEYVIPQGPNNLLKELERIRDEMFEKNEEKITISNALTDQTEACNVSD